VLHYRWQELYDDGVNGLLNLIQLVRERLATTTSPVVAQSSICGLYRAYLTLPYLRGGQVVTPAQR